MNRKKFMMNTLGGFALISTSPISAALTLQKEPEPLKREMVKEFVIAGHFNLSKVKEMLHDHPNLIYAKHDWGNGDFEEAIEGAGHKGNKEVANYLIEKGARVNLFILTMLGKTMLVKSILEEFPGLLFSKGTHGLTLLHHAEIGGEESKELADYFQMKGLKEKSFKLR
ncbi:hypothetical protein [Aquimarina algiphila]|uniref:hypothetical protein n=1 Tax=Aquimarina algiphila TaxID=2047982 RepID=UPI00248F6FED|nr:hypothetical protein [Aquimarina algiphila]